MAELVAKARPEVGTLTLTVHQMSVVCHPGQATTNSPEGIHQDGADDIVSALVVERRGVTGGMSRVFGSDREAVLICPISAARDSSKPMRARLFGTMSPQYIGARVSKAMGSAAFWALIFA